MSRTQARVGAAAQVESTRTVQQEGNSSEQSAAAGPAETIIAATTPVAHRRHGAFRVPDLISTDLPGPVP
jgi:hypothetical protein